MLFGDLNCPFTMGLTKTLRALLDEQPAALRLVWRHRPLDVHPAAGKASQVAERLALGSGERSFWRFVMAMSELQGKASDSALGELEQALQARPLKLDQASADARAAARVERDRLIALSYSIHATPTLFVNGLRFEGEISRTRLEQIIVEERAEVQSLLDDDVPPNAIYSIRVDANLLDLDRE